MSLTELVKRLQALTDKINWLEKRVAELERQQAATDQRQTSIARS